jgi:endoglucanase
MRELDGFPCTLYGAATVQEEVGLRGARTAAAVVDPDVAIILEGAPASDTYGSDREDGQGILGGGVQIRFFDPTMIANQGLRRLMIETAESEKIPYQVLVRDKGGTDAGRIHLHGRGVPSIVLAVTVRYAHSPTGLIHADDYESALRLLKAAVMKLDEGTVSGFVH